MKTFTRKSINLFLLFLATATILSSCGTDDTNEDDTMNLGGDDFFAQVNGVAFDPDFVTGLRSEVTNTILVTGSMGDGELIQLFIPQDATASSYELGLNQASSVIAYYQTIDGDATDVAAFATSGTVTVSAHNIDAKTIEGTFNFTGAIDISGEMYTITEGSFSVSYNDI